MSFLFLSKITACGIVVPSFFCSGMYVAKDHSPFITNSSHQNTTLTKFTASLFCERMAVKSIVVLLCECNAERKWTDRSAEIRIHIHQHLSLITRIVDVGPESWLKDVTIWWCGMRCKIVVVFCYGDGHWSHQYSTKGADDYYFIIHNIKLR